MQEVSIQKTSPVLEIVLSGEIDSKNADEFEAKVLAAYNAAPCDVVFDCEKLIFIDSTTLGSFVKIFKHVREDRHGMRFIKMQPRIKKLFVICALDAIMEIE